MTFEYYLRHRRKEYVKCICDNSSVVYIEEVVADNLIINAILLTVTVGILKDKRVWWRLLLSSVLGTVFAVFLPFIDKAVFVYKLAALIATTLFAVHHKNVKRYILFILVFAAVSFAAGGAAYGIFNLTVGKNGAIVYPSGNGLKYAVFSAIIFLLIVLRQMGRFARRRQISASKEVCAVISIGGDDIKVDCLNDTGNKLVDNLTAKPVAVLSHDVGAHYVGGSARMLEVGTVAGKKKLPVVTAEKITFCYKDGDRVYEKMPLVVADGDFDDYKLVVNLGAL